MKKEFSPNAARLYELMRAYRKTRKDVAEIGRWAESTVDTWLAPVGASCYVPMPTRALRLIELELRGASSSGKTTARRVSS